MGFSLYIYIGAIRSAYLASYGRATGHDHDKEVLEVAPVQRSSSLVKRQRRSIKKCEGQHSRMRVAALSA